MLRDQRVKRRWRLTWDEEDTRLMARIIGGDFAERKRAPVLMSIVKAAARRGVRIEMNLRGQLEQAVKAERFLKSLRKMTDGPGDEAFFAHQRADLRWLTHSMGQGYTGHLLAHQPGVGKTLVAIHWAAALVKATRVLVITPNQAKEQWAREIERWTPTKAPTIVQVEGTTAEQIRAAAWHEGWIIGHWESLVHARLGYLQRSWDAIILDEAHHIQNRHAKRSETVFELRGRYRMALTGHPYTNNGGELFSILRFLYPTTYTSFWRFIDQHVEVSEKRFGGIEIIGMRQPKLLKWELSPFTTRRTKKSLGWLPPTPVRRSCDLTAKGRREYDRLRKEFFAELEAHEGERKVLAIPSVLARITRLRQYLIDPGLLGAAEPSVKYPLLHQLLVDELDRTPTVIFTEFREAAIRLGQYLATKKLRIGYIMGVTSKRERKQRAQAQQRFLDGRFDAMLVVRKVGATALNLGGYGYVAHLDLPWNPRDFEQSEGRVDRPEEGTGRVVPTTSYRFIVRGSYEERLEQKLKVKYGMFKEVFTVTGLKELFG
jgi:SNF2 family DNA or RNA helicase